jgi:DNA-binding IclR family transcriptional regulator
VGATAHLTIAEGGEAVALAVVEPSWTAFHVAYRAGSRHPLDRGAAGRAILAGRQGDASVIATAGELQPGAHGVAAPVLGLEGLEASVGVVALSPLDPEVVGPQVVSAAAAVAQALS